MSQKFQNKPKLLDQMFQFLNSIAVKLKLTEGYFIAYAKQLVVKMYNLQLEISLSLFSDRSQYRHRHR